MREGVAETKEVIERQHGTTKMRERDRGNLETPVRWRKMNWGRRSREHLRKGYKLNPVVFQPDSGALRGCKVTPLYCDKWSASAGVISKTDRNLYTLHGVRR